MRVTATGHAGLKVETAGTTLLLDPWMSPEGAFQGAWFQYPDPSHLLKNESFFRPTAVVISHEHLDHVDPWFLARVAGDVPVVIPRYPSPALRQKILMGGPRRIIEAEQWEIVTIGDTEIFFVSEPPMNHDSAIMVKAEGQTLLDLNDARLFPVQLREIKQKLGGKIDIFAFQGAGASWFPMRYEYSPERARELSRQKRLSKFAYCMKSMRVVEPVIGLPIAGPPAFLDPQLFRHNAEMEDPGIFPDQQQVADWLATRRITNVAVLLPGDMWDANTATKIPDPIWQGFSFDDRWPYLEQYQQRRAPDLQRVLSRYPEPTESLRPAFDRYFTELLGMSPYFNERINMRVGFDITGAGGGQWAVDFRPGQQGIFEGLDGCGYIYSFESRWLPPLLDGRTPWEDFFLSLRFTARRNPDLYNDHLLGLLKFADRESLGAVERFETAEKSDERITIHSEGNVYSVSRYCPHAGNDLLETGEVIPGGMLRCLAHHYDFDLATGRCITGVCEPIHTQLVGREEDVTARRS